MHNGVNKTRYDHPRTPVKQTISIVKPGGTWPYQSQDEQIHYQIEVYRMNYPILRKLNQIYQTQFWNL